MRCQRLFQKVLSCSWFGTSDHRPTFIFEDSVWTRQNTNAR